MVFPYSWTRGQVVSFRVNVVKQAGKFSISNAVVPVKYMGTKNVNLLSSHLY